MHTPLTFAADANTDIWKKPPAHDVFTAPYRVHSKGPTLGFKSACITFLATYTHQFDQAGILFKFTNGADRKWIKSGIELFNDAPRLSTVCTDNYSDWSVSDAPCGHEVRNASRPVTISVERSDDGTGTTLWVYHLDRDGGKTPLREITWPFGTAAGDGWEVEVAAAVARPSKDTADKLEATFTEFTVDWN
ncbi:hypothetical protein H634G_09332 [Metarhizium anisopliae BRIP 53293]|uniref:DUF1349 domain-containing protein n=1 Tax=Metarhizium anisopliae BRIP 53293 TaxID=1291518 RepID=A0A0D9NMZ4_METAN|nr:hypothetical protein H634G_09332 [Metarhizium anisopliae BRIP 53293]KJK91730.1 hypothetical protein H633G_04346 [Metarhizium anisopliae BRIP 53284]